MAQIDCFLATTSPYVYLAGTRLQEIAARYGAQIAYKPVDPIALFARTGGVAPNDRHASRKAYRAQELRRQAVKCGLPITLEPRHRPTNPAPSAYAIIAAQAAVAEGGSGGAGDLGGLIHGFGRAMWAEERNIAEDAVVRAVLADHGFDPRLADSGLLLDAETYGANLEAAVARGAFGVPFYITDADERFWGQDRLADLDAHLAGRL